MGKPLLKRPKDVILRRIYATKQLAERRYRAVKRAWLQSKYHIRLAMGESDTNYAHRVAVKLAGSDGDIRSIQDQVMSEIQAWNRGEHSALPVAFGQAMSKVEELELLVKNIHITPSQEKVGISF